MPIKQSTEPSKYLKMGEEIHRLARIQADPERKKERKKERK